MKKLALLMVSAMFAVPVLAAQPAGSKGGFDSSKVFFGGGLSQNDVSGSDEGTGFQFFGGYEFGEVAKNVKLDVEVGYMTTGDMDVCAFGFCVSAEAKGLWSTAVGRFALNPEWELVGRAGMDFGDDDGFMFGAGVGYQFNKTSAVRFELVERDAVSSLQVNFVYRP